MTSQTTTATNNHRYKDIIFYENLGHSEKFSEPDYRTKLEIIVLPEQRIRPSFNQLSFIVSANTDPIHNGEIIDDLNFLRIEGAGAHEIAGQDGFYFVNGESGIFETGDPLYTLKKLYGGVYAANENGVAINLSFHHATLGITARLNHKFPDGQIRTKEFLHSTGCAHLLF